MLFNVNPIIVFVMLCSADCSQLAQKLFNKKTSRQYLKSFVLPKNVNNIYVSHFFLIQTSFLQKINPASKLWRAQGEIRLSFVKYQSGFLLFVSKKVEHFLTAYMSMHLHGAHLSFWLLLIRTWNFHIYLNALLKKLSRTSNQWAKLKDLFTM